MLPDLRTWTCGQCKRTILVPPVGDDGRPGALVRIGEHRLAHLTEALMHGSDEDLLGLCRDEPAEPEEMLDPLDFVGGVGLPKGATVSLDNISAAMGKLRGSGPTPPVDSDDVAPVLAGIEGLLRDDLPRARRFWYPINEDGGFNR